MVGSKQVQFLGSRQANEQPLQLGKNLSMNQQRKTQSQSRGNPFQPASPATPGSTKMQADYERRQMISSGNMVGKSNSQDRKISSQGLM